MFPDVTDLEISRTGFCLGEPGEVREYPVPLASKRHVVRTPWAYTNLLSQITTFHGKLGARSTLSWTLFLSMVHPSSVVFYFVSFY